MRHLSESITTRKISRSERERVHAVQTIIHSITDRHRFPNLSEHFQAVAPPQPITEVPPELPPLVSGWDSNGQYHWPSEHYNLRQAYFEKPMDL